MKKVYLFLAEGFEEIEALMVVDLLRRAEISVTTVGIMGDLKVRGRSNIEVMADILFEKVESFEDGDMLVLPGGMPGTRYLEEYEPLRKLIKKYLENDKKLAAICAAPTVFGKMGLLKEKAATCYPGMEDELYCAQTKTDKVVVDGNITTSRGLGTALEFALELISQLENGEKAEKVAESVVFLTK